MCCRTILRSAMKESGGLSPSPILSRPLQRLSTTRSGTGRCVLSKTVTPCCDSDRDQAASSSAGVNSCSSFLNVMVKRVPGSVIIQAKLIYWRAPCTLYNQRIINRYQKQNKYLYEKDFDDTPAFMAFHRFTDRSADSSDC